MTDEEIEQKMNELDSSGKFYLNKDEAKCLYYDKGDVPQEVDEEFEAWFKEKATEDGKITFVKLKNIMRE